jgi:hypothetical protein
VLVVVLAIVANLNDVGGIDCERVRFEWAKKVWEKGKRRTLLIVRVDIDALVAELLEVELDVILVLAKAVKEVDVLAVIWRGSQRLEKEKGGEENAPSWINTSFSNSTLNFDTSA